MRVEEETRRRNELERKNEQQRQFMEERKLLDAQIHSNHLANNQPKPTQIPQLKSPNNPKKGQLIGGRTQYFEQKVAELNTQFGKPLIQPNNFKYQVFEFL